MTRFPTYQAVREALGAQLNGIPPAVDFLAKQEGAPALITAVRKALAKRPPTVVEIRRLIADRFSLDGVRTLCFDLGVDFESLPSEGREAKARELVAECQRRGRLGELLILIRRDHGRII